MSLERLLLLLFTANLATFGSGRVMVPILENALVQQSGALTLDQFLFAFGNDEGDEATSFQGTIPQALMMMNGELMQDALSGKPGSFLEGTIEQAQKQARSPELYLVNQIYLAALSRYPSRKELTQAGHYLAMNPDSLQVLQDLFWALLNSNEFILIH